MLALYKGMEYYYDPITNTSGSNLVWAITPAFSLGWRGNRTYIDVGAAFLVNEEFVFPYLSLKRKIIL